MRKFKANTIMIQVMFIMIILSSCSEKLSGIDKQLLLFAETEDTYHHQGNIDYLDIHQMNTKAINLYTKGKVDLEIQHLKSTLEKFPEHSLTKILKSIHFPCSYRYIINELNDTQYTLDVELKIPDSVSTYHLTKKDIGKELRLNGVNAKLLKIEENEAVLWVQDVRSEELQKRNLLVSERKSTKKETRYAKFGDFKEYQQFTIEVFSASSKPLIYESKVTDFNHYVWYRKRDIEYEKTFREDPFYIKLWEVYSNLNDNLRHKYKNLNLVHIRSIGKIESLKVMYEPTSKNTLKKIHVGTFNKGNNRSINFFTPQPFETISNLTEEQIKDQIKIGYDNSKLKKEKEEHYIYFSLPHNFHTDFNLKIEEANLITKDGFSESIEASINSYQNNHPLSSIINTQYDNRSDNFRLAVFKAQNISDYQKLEATLKVDYPIFKTITYSIDNLPEKIEYDKVNKSLKFAETGYHNFNLDQSFLLRALDNQGKPISYFNEFEAQYTIRHYTEEVEKIELNTYDKMISFSMPITLKIPKQKQSYIKNFDYDVLNYYEPED